MQNFPLKFSEETQTYKRFSGRDMTPERYAAETHNKRLPFAPAISSNQAFRKKVATEISLRHKF